MYVKLFGSILDSSIWEEDHATVRVWITMLSMANPDGVVEASPSGLARRANVSPAECRKAVEIFEKPDIESKSQEWAGRRIEKVDGGWLLLNYKKYREMQTKKQAIDAARQARKRKRERDTSRQSRSVHVEGEGEGEGEEEGEGEVEANSTVDLSLVPTRDRPVAAKGILSTLEEIEWEDVAADKLLALQVLTGFGYWVKIFKKDNNLTKLTKGRWDRLEKYLAMYDIATVLYAIDGAKIHPDMNPEGRPPHHEFEKIFMNKPEGPGRVEKLAEYARKKDKRSKHRMIEAHPGLEGKAA